MIYIKIKYKKRIKEALKWDLIWVLISHGAYGTTGLETI